MSESHYQVNPDGTTSKRKTVLWPGSKNLQEPIIRSLFEHNNWKVSEIKNQSGSFWKVISSCNDKTCQINLYISSIRDEDRQLDEFKMQLGTSYPENEEPGWITLVLGIYTIAIDDSNPIYILAGYDRSRYDFSTNPSLRGTRTSGLQKAYTLGMYKNDNCILFRPEFIYYYIDNLSNLFGKASKGIPFSTTGAQSSSHLTISYLTALRTKPFMLLAGISGTGKSRIVRKLAQASVTEELQKKYDPSSVEKGFNRWDLHKPANFELIQVKPNWHNSLEVVGYKSRIGGAHYEFTPFVEFVARAWKHPEVPFFLCLDEMNLAPVEQYFAEFLSAIESRSIENGEYETDPIIKPFVEFGGDLWKSMVNHLLGDVNASDAASDSPIAKLVERFKTKGLTLPQNLLVLGTVNMDETTFSFSRKVLDRAMSVVMNAVEYKDFFSGASENDVAEMSEDVKEWLIDRPIRGLDAENNEADEVKTYLTNINIVLEDTPFKLGYRAANEALLYVSAAQKFNPNADLNTTLDEFTLMKILSRIEGDKRSIGGLLVDLQNVITSDYPQSNKKLIKMAETLKDKQFVSYWT